MIKKSLILSPSMTCKLAASKELSSIVATYYVSLSYHALFRRCVHIYACGDNHRNL